MQQSIDLETLLNANRNRDSAPSKSVRSSLLERLVFHKVTDRDKAEFCMQLAVMLQAKVTLHRALEALSKQVQSGQMKGTIEKLENQIRKGNSFSKALAAQPEIFETLFVITAEVGEESGRLPDVLMNLAIHLEKMSALKRKFMQALTYPALVISVAFFAVTFLLVFIVPTFAEMFKNFQMELPTSTRIVLAISDSVTLYGGYVAFAGILFAAFSWKTIRSKRQKIESVILQIPFIGDIILKNHVARFCRTLGTLLQAQVSLLEALDVTQRIITIPGMQDEIRIIIKQVRKGSAITEPMIDSKYFPPMVSQMIAVGEETSELDRMLLKVADYYERELDSKVETLSSVIEPVLILILGLIVAAILVSMYMPMFDLVNLVGTGN